MLEKPPDLSPDLEWMLQCGRASEVALVEALAREHFVGVYDLALDITGSQQRAEQVAARALAEAVLNAHRYPAELGLRNWLFSLVRERAGAPRGPQSGHHLDLPPAVFSDKAIERVKAEIHRFIARERRKRQLFAAREILIAALAILGLFFAERWMSGLTPEPTRVPTLFQTAFVTQLVYVSPTPPSSATPTPFPERAILYVAEEGDTLASIARKTGLEAALLQALNGLEPDAPLEAGQAVMLGLGGAPLAHVTPTPVTPAALPEPLTTASEPQEVFLRIFQSERFFNTLWVQAQVIDYGPPGFVGRPRVKRIQAWISRPSYSLTLLGGPDGSLERVSLTNSGKTYAIDSLTGERFLYTSYGLDLMQLDELIQQAYSAFETGSEQQIVGIEAIAGREALVMDWFQPGAGFDGSAGRSRRGRYWVDTLTGVILRLQRFVRGEDGAEFLVYEAVINEIAYDVDLNNALFDPYRPLPTRFARDLTGDPYPEDLFLPIPTWVPLAGREPLPRLTPPPDYDPSRSRLTFQWTHGSAFDNDQSTLTDIFAGRYYLGSVDLGDPDRLICTRSPDGRKIAYSEWLESPPYGAAPLRWLDLGEVSRFYQPLDEVGAMGLSFSPDSQRLAFLGGDTAYVRGLYVLDLASGDWKRILVLSGGDNLRWSPDGRYLALTGAEHPNTDWKLLVIDSANGEITYRGPVEWDQEGRWIVPADSPVLAWGLASLPPRMSAIEACARPPN